MLLLFLQVVVAVVKLALQACNFYQVSLVRCSVTGSSTSCVAIVSQKLNQGFGRLCPGLFCDCVAEG
jgi:hypothetical protein